MKTMLKSTLVLILVLVALVSVCSSAGAEEKLLIYTFEEVLELVYSLDPDATYEIVAEADMLYMDVAWSFGLMGYVQVMEVEDDVNYVAFDEDVNRMMLCACSGIEMDITNHTGTFGIMFGAI